MFSSPNGTKDLHPVNIGTSLFLVATGNFHGPLVVHRMSESTGHFEIRTIPTSKAIALNSFLIVNTSLLYS